MSIARMAVIILTTISTINLHFLCHILDTKQLWAVFFFYISFYNVLTSLNTQFAVIEIKNCMMKTIDKNKNKFH